MRTHLSFAGLMFVCAAAAAQVSTPSYGVSSLSTYVIDAYGMEPAVSGTDWSRDLNGNRYTTTLNAGFIGIVLLPEGAQIVSFELEACDNSPSGEVVSGMVRWGGAGVAILGVISTGGVIAPGCSRFLHTLAAPETVDNSTYRYQVEALNSTIDGSTSIGSVRIFYVLQVSAPPGTATFGDVQTGHAFFQFVEALAASGITAGCGGGNFCPDSPLTRGQMAVFLAKALGLHFSVLPGP